MALNEIKKPTIEEVLANTSVAKLKELAKDYYVKGYSKLNKAALVEVVSSALQKPKRLTELLYVLDTSTFMLFKRAAESQQPIKVKKLQSEQYKLLVDLCYLVCEESQADMVVTVPSQISDVFLQLERGDFSKRKARYDLLNSYAMATVHLYGVISQDDFVDIFNRQNSQKTSIEELFPVLIRHIAVGAPYCFWDEYIVCDEFEENDFQDVKDLLRQCDMKPRYVPEKKELLRYADWDYYEQTPQMDKLKQFLAEQCRQPRCKAEEVAAEIQYACAVEAGVGQVFEILEEYHVDLDDKSVSSFVEIITAVQNNTRLWANKGHTPNELATLYNRRPPFAMSGVIKKQKIGRNDPCPCGSGKKYKKCCGR